jgi:DNA-binding NarL/FixJ family response regulator
MSESRETVVARLHWAGYSQADIGACVGCSGQYVSRILKKLGLDTNVGGYLESRSSIKAKHQEILKLAAEGHGCSAIAQIMYMSSSGVHYVLSRNLRRF